MSRLKNYKTILISVIISICFIHNCQNVNAFENNTQRIDTIEPVRLMLATSSTFKPKPTESYSKHKVITKLNYFNGTVTSGSGIKRSPITGNILWDNLISECLVKPTFSCIQKNVYTYLDDTLTLGDVNVTDRFKFKKNKITTITYTKDVDDEENEIKDDDDDSDEFEGRSESPIEEVTDALYGKGVKFMMTHDVELRLPETLFDGATFKVSPRSIEGNGALIKIEFLPKELSNPDKASPRIFFKKIKKFFKNKLLLAFLAIVLLIKIIKIKLFWILPLFIGVGAAKKLVLKLLLFLFPALAQIFKLCSWYHNNYHQTKYHHHSHHINHLHTIIPTLDDHHGHHQTPPSTPYGHDVIYSHPPKGHPAEYIHGAPPPPHGQLHAHEHTQYYPHEPQPQWDFSGPGLGSEYIGDVHRNAQVSGNGFKPKLDDYNEILSWGLGTTSAPISSQNSNPLVQNQITRSSNKAESQLNPVYTPGNTPAKRYPAYNNIQLLDQRSQDSLRIQQEQKLIAHQQQLLNQQPFVQSGDNYISDPFYTPILNKIDKVFGQLGFHEMEEGCRERLVCSMYKNPTRYSPHSNYISAELSRDSTELQKPQSTNAAVIRFYRYIQSARDGQDQRDCLQLYPSCSISTE